VDGWCFFFGIFGGILDCRRTRGETVFFPPPRGAGMGREENPPCVRIFITVLFRKFISLFYLFYLITLLFFITVFALPFSPPLGDGEGGNSVVFYYRFILLYIFLFDFF